MADRVAIVTGGGSGVGRSVAEALHGDGWSVVVCGRTRETIEATVAGLEGAVAVTADVADAASVEKVFGQAVDRFGRVDLLFNNAGVGAPPLPIDELTVEQWRAVVDVNLTGSFLCARAAFAQMKKQVPSGGRIINNGSVSATTPRPFSAPYTATKHGITGLTKALALDGRSIGITCGQIDIGNAATAMTDQAIEGLLQPDGTIRPEALMDVEDVASAVVLMANLPPETNVLSMTIMANRMPYIGRG